MIKAEAQKLFAALELSGRELSVLITDDKEIRALNRDYRNKDKATDVLSFPLEERGDSEVLGDLVISLPTAKRQAKEYSVTFKEEFRRLFIHGLLHLLGHDHENVSRQKAEKMRRMEKKLLKDMGAAARGRRPII
jgi:probable rRNA maturation factor